jgi:hypothetical protein
MMPPRASEVLNEIEQGGLLMTKSNPCAAAIVVAALFAQGAVLAASAAPATPKEMVATYDALADTILGGIKTERKLVLAILNATYAHAQVEAGRARQALEASDSAGAREAIENLATAVGQIGTEGDNAVAGIRKRLLEGGHHANSEGEAQGVFEEGYAIVTKAAKKAFLDSAQALAMLARAPKADALEAEWKKVEAAWAKHVAGAK